MANSYVISVSLGTGCYRHIQISASATLFQLHKIILSSFQFEDDHAHAFFMDNHIWSAGDPFFSMKMRGDELLTTEYTLADVMLAKGDKFKYLFDFGADWCFQCKVLRELEDRTDIPGVIRSVGQAPEQYPDFNAEDERIPQIYEQEQVEELYRNLPVPQSVVRLVRRYCEAASHLYGITPLWVVLELYNDQNDPISQEDFLQITEVMRHEANDFVILGAETLFDDAPVVDPIDREIISVMILECGLEEYYRLAEMQQGKAFVYLPKEQFLSYEDSEFFAMTPQRENMFRFLKKRERNANMVAEDALAAILLLLWLDAPVQAIVEGLEENNFAIRSKSAAKEFATLLQDLNNHTEKVANRGATPFDMVADLRHEVKKPPAEKVADKDPNQISLWGDDV